MTFFFLLKKIAQLTTYIQTKFNNFIYIFINSYYLLEITNMN